MAINFPYFFKPRRSRSTQWNARRITLRSFAISLRALRQSLKSNIMKGGIFSSKTLRKNESPSNRGMFPIVNMTIVKSRAYLRGKNHRKSHTASRLRSMPYRSPFDCAQGHSSYY